MTANRQERFRDILHTRYLSHVHTNYGGGNVTVEEYCRWAMERGYKTIVFSEYVHCRMEYDFEAYCQDIEQAREKYPSLRLWIGAEATVLPFGSLDFPEELLPRVEALFLACHDFPGDAERYRNAMEMVFRDERWKEVPRIWAHPGRFFRSGEWTENAGAVLQHLIDIAIEEHILIENNLREALPPVWLLRSIPISELIVGFGAKSIDDLSIK